MAERLLAMLEKAAEHFKRRSIVVLISGRGSNLLALIEAGVPVEVQHHGLVVQRLPLTRGQREGALEQLE